MKADSTVETEGTLAKPSVNPLRLEKSADAMGSTFSIIVYGDDLARMEEAVAVAFGELHRLDRMLSNYQPDSEWSQMNFHAAHLAVTASPELFQLLSDCQKYSERSEGAFDITVGPLMKAWGFYKGTGRLPDPSEVSAALAHVGYRNLHLDPARQTVQFDHPGVELDPGGIGKGYAIDRMVGVLQQQGFASALVAGSGSSIYGLGTPPTETKGWRVRVADARDPRTSATEIFLKNMSISTSGSFEKSFYAEGRTYSHMIDPRSGYPAEGTALVSVVAPRTVDSEAWTKPCLIHGRTWAEKHKPEDFRIFFCDDTKSSGTWLEARTGSDRATQPLSLKRG